jgi:hypothetical protein
LANDHPFRRQSPGSGISGTTLQPLRNIDNLLYSGVDLNHCVIGIRCHVNDPSENPELVFLKSSKVSLSNAQNHPE